MQLGASRVHRNRDDTALLAQPGGREWGIAMAPPRRIGTVDDIAKGVLFLASDESSFMTGTEMIIDGGWTAQ